MKLNEKLIVIAVGLGLIGTSQSWAADPAGNSIHTPNNDAYTTAPVNDTAKSAATSKPKHKRKSHTEKSAPNSAAAPATPPTSGAIGAPGVPGNLYGNDAGMSNKGSGDHTPGTTGTSGQ